MADRAMGGGLPDHYLSPREPPAAELDEPAVAPLSELSFCHELEPELEEKHHHHQQQQQQQRLVAAPEEERRPAEGLVSGATPTVSAVLPRPHRRLVGIFGHQAGDGAVSPPPRPGPPAPTLDGPALLAAADWAAATGPRPDYGDGEAAPVAAPPLPARPSGRRRWRRPAPAGWCSDDSNPAEAAPRRRELPDDASVTSVDSEAPLPVESRGTSPSVLSTGSVASSRRLEWDAAADVGYQATAPLRPADSLSTLERIAIGSYAGVLRSEPEGTGRPAAPRRRHRPLLCRTGHHQEPIAEEAERRRGSHEPSPAALPSSEENRSDEEEDGRDVEKDRLAGRRSVPRDGSSKSVRRSQKRLSRAASPRHRRSPGRRPRPVSAEVRCQRRGRLTAKKSSSLSELSASPQQPRQPLQCRGDGDSRDSPTVLPGSAARGPRGALTSASSCCSSGDDSDAARRCSNALFFTSSDTLVALPGHVPLPVTLSKLDSSLSQSSPNSSLPLSGGSLKNRSSAQTSKQSIQTVIFTGGGAEEADSCAGARPPDSDRSAAAGAATASGRSSLDQLPTRDTGRPAAAIAPAMSSFLETSEGSCYSSAYTAAAAAGGGTQLLSTLHNSAALPAELAPWGGRGSSSLTGASSAAPACCEPYASASVSQEGFSGALCGRSAPSGGGGLLLEERTGAVTEEEDTGRQQAVRQASSEHRDMFRDALECSGGSQQAEAAAGGTESAITAEDMSVEEAEERVRGLYRRLRGADHFRSLPALDQAAAGGGSPDHRPESVAEFRRICRPVPHFSAERDLTSIHIQLRAQLATLHGCLEEPRRGDLHKYVDFIGTSCLDEEDETLKREMAEKVMRLLLQRKGAAAGTEPVWDAADCTQDPSGAASQPSGRSAVTAESGWEAERWPPGTAPLCSRVPTPYSGERPASPVRRRPAASPPARRGSGAAAAGPDRPELGELGRRSGAWRHQLTCSERGLQAGAAEADGEQSETSEAAWRSHNYGCDPCDNHEGRPTDTTSSDYDFNTIRSRQRRLEDATASSFEYYDPGPRRRRSSPDEGASVPEPAVRSPVRSPAREASPPSPAPTLGSDSDLLGLLRHTTDNVIRHSREMRTRRTPVPLSVSSGAAAAPPAAAAADGRRRRPRSGDTAGSRRSARTTSGETSRRLGALVGQHRQKHVQQLRHDITKLGRLERMLLAGSAVQLDGRDSSEGGAVTGSDCRRGVEGRSSPSDSDSDSDSKAEDGPPPPGPSSAYSRIRETLQRRRRQIEAQLADMDSRHRRCGRRLERFADPAEEAASDTEESGSSCRRAGTRSSSQRRRPAASTAGVSSRRPRTGGDSQRRAVSSQETGTQTSTQTSGRCEPGSAGASVQVHRRRRRVPASPAGAQTVSGGRQPDGAAQVFTRWTRLPASDSATQTASSGPRPQPSRTVTVTRRQLSSGSPSPRRSHVAVQTTRSPERTVTVTRRRAAPEPTVSRPGGVSRPTGGPGRASATGRREVVVRRRSVASGGSAETETVTTADTTADTSPSSAATKEGMRDVLEPSDRTGQRSEDVERAERLLESVGQPFTASHATDGEDGPASSRLGSSFPRSDSLSGTGRDAGGPDRSLDARRAQHILRQGVRLDELEQALWKAESQELPSCPVSPRRDWPSSSDQSRSVGTQTCLLAAPAADGDALRRQTVRRQVHSDGSEVIHHPPQPPAARRSVAYFLSVRRGPLPPPPRPDDEGRCRRVLPAVRLSQELLASSGSEPAAGAECVREEDEECSERGQRVSVTRRRPAGRPCAAECVSLQEALCQRRPDYIRNAAVRRQYLQRLAELRRTNLERAARAAQTLPELPTDADWCHFADSLRPENVRRAFDYRDMRQHTERLWRRLPEIRDCVAKRKKHAQFRTNRLMWQVYKQKLQARCLRGDVHMTHRDAVLGGL